MFKLTPFQHLTCAAFAAALMVGCTETDSPAVDAAKPDGSHADHEHDHSGGDHPETYAEAVKALTAIDDTIKNAFAKDDKDAAHGPLHDVGDILTDLNDLANDADMTDEQRKSVRAEVEKLFEAFGAVDETMHGKEGKSYDEVASEIEASLKVLTDACATESKEGQE